MNIHADKIGPKWSLIYSDTEFAGLFVGREIVAAMGGYDPRAPKDAPDVDLLWQFSDGSWLAHRASKGGGCDTCGYGDETEYWRRYP